jgi:hypothetical protein
LGAGIDKELRGARIGTRRGKDDGTTSIGHLDRIIGYGCAPPFGLHVGLAIYSKLHHKAGQYAKKATIVPKTNVGQFLQTKKEEHPTRPVVRDFVVRAKRHAI